MKRRGGKKRRAPIASAPSPTTTAGLPHPVLDRLFRSEHPLNEPAGFWAVEFEVFHSHTDRGMLLTCKQISFSQISISIQRCDACFHGSLQMMLSDGQLALVQ